MKKKLHFLVNIAYYGALALLIVLAVRYLVPVLLPFLLGFFVASAFNSLVSKLSRYRKRAFAAAVVILPFWGVLLFLLWKAGALFYREAAELLEWIQHTDFQEILSRMELDDFMPISYPLDQIYEAFDTFFTGNYLKVLINCNEDLADL